MRRALAVLAAMLVLAAPAAAAPVGKGTPKGKLAAYGYHLFGLYCLSCHGANAAGRGQSPSYGIGFGPRRSQDDTTYKGIGPSLHGVGALAADFYLRTGYMPLPHVGLQPRRNYGNNLLAPTQIKALTAYIATFGGPPIPTPHPERGNLSEGLSLFTSHCAGCHQVVAQGGFVTGAVAPALEDADSVEIAEAVRIGPYVMPTFTKKALSDRQLDSIIRYVNWAKHPYHPGGWSLGYIGPVPEGLVTWFIAAIVLVLVCIVIGKRLTRIG